MNNVQGTKKYAGSAIAALLIFGAVATALVIPQTAYAAVTIETSENTFFGPGFVRVLITDTAKTTAGDTIVPTIEARRGSTSLGTVSPTIFAIGTSGAFEVFVTTSNSPLAPNAPTHTADPDGGGAYIAGPFVVRANAAPGLGTGTAFGGTTAAGAATNANGVVGLSVGTNNYGLTTSSALKSGDTIRITYGGQVVNISFTSQTATLGSDRTTAGTDNEIVLSLTDRDANSDPTLVDTFVFGTPTDLLTSTNAVTYTGAATWTETGQNTGVFEQTIVVNGAAPNHFITATLPAGNSFTAKDHDVYEALSGASGLFAAVTATSSTSSASVTLQNTDAIVSLVSQATFANGLIVQINDPDRNISTSGKDTITTSSLTLGGAPVYTITDDGTADTSEVFTVTGVTVTTQGATSGTITIVNTSEFTANPGATTAAVGVTGTGAGLTLGTATVSVGTPGGADPTITTVTIPFTTTGAISAIALGTVTVTLTTTTAAETLVAGGSGSVATAVLRATTVDVEGIAGFVNGVDFEETGDNTGIFRAMLTRESIPIAFGAADTIGATSITLINTTIEGDPDITFIYSDPAPQSGTANKQFKVITTLAHSAGTLDPTQTTVGVTDSFSLQLTDADLNTNPDTIETYTMTTFNGNNAVFAGLNTATTRIAELSLKAKGSTINLSTAGLTVTFIETGPNTGIFTATNIDMGVINAAVTGGLSDGDQVEFKYNDLMQDPNVDDGATITVGKPSTTITADRTTVPVPTTGTVTKVTITVTDPSMNLNSGSVETITIPAVDITVTPRTTGLVAKSDFTTAGLNQAQTLTETGPSTGVFTKTIDLAKAAAVADANYEGAKIKFVYDTTQSVTVTLKTYDAVLTTSISNVKNGDKFTVTVNDLDMNKDPATAEKITLTSIQGKSDDHTAVTTMQLTETGADTGVFTKSVTVGKDFKVTTLPTTAAPGVFLVSTSVELKYTETIASDNSTPTREHTVKIGNASGTIEVTPTIVGPGTKFTLMVTDADLNSNPEGVDTIPSTTTTDWVKLTSDPSGAPSATVGMEETGANTGVMKATVQLSPRATTATAPVFTASGVDHAYTALPGDIISVRYTDIKNAAGNKVVVSKTFLVTSVDPTMTTPEPSVAAGSTVALTITDVDANLDGDAQDSVRVKITSDSDPVGFELSALETGVNTGIFTVNVPTTTSVSSGSVTVKTGDSIYLKYTDTYPADYADRVKQVVDPSKDFTYVVLVGTPGGDPTSTTPSAPVLKDISGNDLTEVTAGSQVILSSDITNNADFSQGFAAIVEVRDADGFTVYLQWQQGVLNPNGQANIGLSWTPDAPGEYTVRTFVLTSISNPGILSPIAESTVTVS